MSTRRRPVIIPKMANSRSPTAPCQEGPSRPIFTFKVLDGELPVAAAEEGEESKHLGRMLILGRQLSPAQSRKINGLSAGRGFGEGQGRRPTGYVIGVCSSMAATWTL